MVGGDRLRPCCVRLVFARSACSPSTRPAPPSSRWPSGPGSGTAVRRGHGFRPSFRCSCSDSRSGCITRPRNTSSAARTRRLSQRRRADRAARRRHHARRPRQESAAGSARSVHSRRIIDRAYYGIRFMGFFVTDPENGAVVGQFPHLYPAAIAIGYGPRRADWRAACLVDSAPRSESWRCSFFGAARRSSRRDGRRRAPGGQRRSGLVRALSRTRRSSRRLLILAGMLAFARAYIDGDRFFGPVAALLLGLSLFARIDGVFAIAAACVAAILLRVEGRPAGFSFFGPMIAVCATGWLYFQPDPPPYTQRPIGTAKQHLSRSGTGRRRCRPLRATGRKTLGPFLRAWIPRVLAVVLAGLAIYAFFFRVPSGRLAVHDANALRTYALVRAPCGAGRGADRPDPRRLAPVLAGSGLAAGGGVLQPVLLLQDSDRARALLDGAPLPAGHPAGDHDVHRQRC